MPQLQCVNWDENAVKVVAEAAWHGVREKNGRFCLIWIVVLRVFIKARQVMGGWGCLTVGFLAAGVGHCG